MNFDMKLHISIEDTGILRFNRFSCRRDKLPELASKWKYQVWREHGCREMLVEKILVNEDEDIKEEVKEYEEDMGRGHLPF
ncbi:hypothetical protein LCL96_04260 [Rossellomorea aquimaris]|uniref:hypothetical protein n=1 Tax=Rossellomorea aquimaris TaxID=189382 RepID=UPI001CD4F9D1|nr:hypothetical protein [Rossellomorea aquimaris]MCA1058131.1 hypothetical protein [Rossellomorea aquimaris]